MKNYPKHSQTFTFFRFQGISLFVVFLLLLNSCSKNTDEPTPVVNQYLVKSEKISDFTLDQLKTRLSAFDPQLALFLKKGIKVYKITYKTKNTDGTDIQASGAVLLPDATDAASLISVQHGTIMSDAEAPSAYSSGGESNTAGSLLASLGYIVAYPDYIGYGASNSVPHPYEHRASLGSSCLDMLRATKEFITQEKANWDKKLYIAGYSEGGYATSCLQKKIEEEASSEFNLRASSCGAGAYDKSAFMKYLLNNKTSGVVGTNQFYVWVLLTYDRIYNLKRALNTYFKEPYATQVQTSKEKVSINVSFDQTITDSFKKGINDGTDTGFLNAVKDNDVFDWKPKTPTRLYHGTADVTVFPFTSENAANAMKAKGATDVQYVPLTGKNHGTAISDYLQATFLFFSSIQ